MTPPPPNTPILIGAGDIINRHLSPTQSQEPLTLILHAISIALLDTCLPPSSASLLQSQIDSISIIRSWTWPYPDLPSLVASHLNIEPTYRTTSPHSGASPVRFLNEAARRIARGESKVCLIAGGESLASLAASAKSGDFPPKDWTSVSEPVESVFSPSTKDLADGIGAKHGIGAPIQVYPLYENATRAHRRQNLQENNIESAELYAEFSEIASRNPLAWRFGKTETVESIATVSAKNRMICYPYPLLMNAFNTINLAGACILTSVSHATALGIPPNNWIYIRGGAGTSDAPDFWNRPNFYTSPSISASLDIALQVSGLRKEDIDLFDFYSCFPIVPKLACLHLGLDVVGEGRQKPVTLLGGLTSFGGAGNNYSMHAITEMIRRLRERKGDTGLILANGGVVTYQQVVCLSSKPREDGVAYPVEKVLPEVLQYEEVPVVDEIAKGEAVVETYTVDFGRDGKPQLGHVVGRLKKTEHRFLANHGDTATLRRLSSDIEEPIGKHGSVRPDPHKKGRNLFFFDSSAKL